MNPVVERCKTEKDCLVLAENAKKKGRIDIVDEANLRAVQLRQEEYRDTGRRPDIDYHACGLKDGEIIYLPDLDIEVEVYSHRKLFFEGTDTYITTIEKELISRGLARIKVVAKWRIKNTDELLNDAYERAYPK
jgi:hypothetical protein